MSGATAARISISLEDRGSDLKVLVDSYGKRVTHQMLEASNICKLKRNFFSSRGLIAGEGESQFNT